MSALNITNWRKASVYLLIATAIIVVDQITKNMIYTSMTLYAENPITSFFSIVHVHNYGAAFGFLNNSKGWQTLFFGGVALIASVIIVKWLLQVASQQRQLSLALGLILGGAIGNLIDRVIYGFVIDFLSFHYNAWAFPAFNVADSTICIGAVLLLMDSFGLLLLKNIKLER